MLVTRILRRLDVVDDSCKATARPLSAASGLVNLGKRIYVVADDESSIGIFNLDADAPGTWLRLLDETLPLEAPLRKRMKPDFESLAVLPPFAGIGPAGQSALLALGSGSSDQRERAVLLTMNSQTNEFSVSKVIDLAPLFRPLRDRFADLNIEGAFVLGERFCLLQRGHRVVPVNAAIWYSLRGMMEWIAGVGAAPDPASVQYFNLGVLDSVPLCFTDGAALPDGGWIFCATAENTADSYHDGTCTGSVIGRVDAAGNLLGVTPLSVLCKAEGIGVTVEADALKVLLVTDADNRSEPAMLLTATLALGG